MRGRHLVRAVIAVGLLVGVYALALAVAVAVVGSLVAVVTLAVRNDVSVGALSASLAWRLSSRSWPSVADSGWLFGPGRPRRPAEWR